MQVGISTADPDFTVKNIFNDDEEKTMSNTSTSSNTSRSLEDIVIGSVFLLLSLAFLWISIAAGISLYQNGELYLLSIPAIFLVISIVFVAVTALDLITGDARQFVRDLRARARATQTSKGC